MEDIAIVGNVGFDHALRAMKDGSRVRRSGWNGKGMWIGISPGATVPAQTLWSEHNRKWALDQPGEIATVLPYITMKTADNKIVPWLASQTDILAEDWEVLQ